MALEKSAYAIGTAAYDRCEIRQSYSDGAGAPAAQSGKERIYLRKM